MKERIPFVIAVAATVVWLAAAGLYFVQLSWAGVTALAPPALAALLTAVAGPIVALWLILVVIEQRADAARLLQRFAELANQERRTQQQAETHARAIAEMQRQASESQSVETRKLALQDLASSAAVLAERLGVVKRDAMAAAWARFGAGDIAVFVQAFLNFAGAHPDIAERVGEAAARDPSARAALAGFVRRFEQLSDAAADDRLLKAVFEEGPLGRGYRMFKQADELAAVAAPVPPRAAPEVRDPLHERLDDIARRPEPVGPDA
jgi:hypothetical protein